MKKGRFIGAIILFLLGIVLILGAPYTPDAFFNIVYNKFDYNFQEIRFLEIVPSVRMAGMILSAWGIAVFTAKGKDK